MPNIAKYLFGGCFFVWVLGMASCSMLGLGASIAVDQFAKSDTAKRIVKKSKELELKEHNERANREASYHRRDDYEADYYDNYRN
ncbi:MULTISPECIES: hypothetical protein [Novosphingobium]|uniref:hypothetical protein n=1 Tax=Novosphingobium TaxID=165696 RepID=UPI001CD4CFBF|nr:hypothetical protein [Novosphingobium percolationis]MCH7629635.1 hypothetical protein [Pseudomonadota bacterium]